MEGTAQWVDIMILGSVPCSTNRNPLGTSDVMCLCWKIGPSSGGWLFAQEDGRTWIRTQGDWYLPAGKFELTLVHAPYTSEVDEFPGWKGPDAFEGKIDRYGRGWHASRGCPDGIWDY